ncbi:MAG: efflux RND transporter periplasmic adaptor subunit [Spirochaetales bacterium]|uniref:Efflux RND transporter periplasmic adaptor subunit n=1 Tax=Candidatus Thalassospirochaeta sargassi TaxID=3119039 RepID=A0AAJ1MPF4_9SPIO|nr:efflux RND transporter periplasmic adaptor subunit [Spirochaetales bacterium]
MKSRRLIIIFLILAAVVLSAFYFLNRRSTDQTSSSSLYVPEEPGIAVEAYRADFGSVIPSIEASGLVTGKQEAVIVSETRGVVEEVSAQIGEYLEKGAPVLRVDSSVAELSMSQAEQQLKSSQIDFNSVKRAYDGGSASEAELARSRGQFSGAEATYEDSLKRFENTVVKTPFAGFLADLENEIGTGNYISEGVRIGKLVDLSAVKVNIFLGGEEVQRIRKGASALIRTASKELEGRVEAIALTSDRNTGSFRVVVEAPNPYGEAIRSGFSADVEIELPEKDSVIIIPESAVLQIGADSWVYVIEENKAVLKRVGTGTVSGSRIEIISGLNAGDSVITTGFKSLSDGAAVIPEYTTAEEE